MTKLPKHTKVEVVEIYGDIHNAIIIPLSIKGTMDVEAEIETLKRKLSEDRDAKYNTFRKSIDSESPTDKELEDSYVDVKITMDLSKLNEEVTEARIKSLKSKRGAKLIEGKTREVLLNELADMMVDLDIRKHILNHTVSRTLWNVLRKPENLREHLFIDVEELEDSLDPDALIEIFSKNIDEAKVEDEDLKN